VVVLIIERKRKKITEKEKEVIIEGGFGGFCCRILSVHLLRIQGCGGGGSVRRRNTLHVVGGRQFLSQARFTGREKKDENN
jgi:hypothetical protein